MITYQVVLPDDFAPSLGYILATGSEPYLPNWVSPRYATYASLTGLFLNVVVITTPFYTINPPKLVTVSGITYFLKGFYGEQRGTPIQPNLFVIAGPQGEAGATGAQGATGATGATGPTGVLSVSLSPQPTSGSVTSGSYVTACSLSLIAGSYLLFGQLQVTGTSPGFITQLRFFNVTSSAAILNSAQYVNAGGTGNSTQLTLNHFAQLVLGSTATIALQAEANTTGVTFNASFGQGMMAVKYA